MAKLLCDALVKPTLAMSCLLQHHKIEKILVIEITLQAIDFYS
jgi:hypothetical protein